MIKIIMIVINLNAAPIVIDGFTTMENCEAEAKRVYVWSESTKFKCVEVK